MNEIEFVSFFFHPTSYVDSSLLVVGIQIIHDSPNQDYMISYKKPGDVGFTFLANVGSKTTTLYLPLGLSDVAFQVIAASNPLTPYESDFFTVYEQINFQATNSTEEFENGVAKISNCSFFIHPAKYSSGSYTSVSMFINHREEDCVYIIKRRHSLEEEFTDVLTTTEKHAAFLSLPNTYFLQILVVAAKISDNSLFTTFVSKPLAPVNFNNFVKVVGTMVDRNCAPMSGVVVLYRLGPREMNFENGSLVINPGETGQTITDEFGNFEMIVPANKGTTPSKRIRGAGTYYIIEFSDQIFMREVDSDRGPVQFFSNLLPPQSKRKRQDQFYGIRFSE